MTEDKRLAQRLDRLDQVLDRIERLLSRMESAVTRMIEDERFPDRPRAN